ncbi:MAG: TIGR00366 family protein [Bacteroidia bacterium]|nr:TIGR00366 family protein [Bacteroidia bacterium]
MIAKLGNYFSETFKRYMPNSFVFALSLTLIIALIAIFWIGASFIQTLEGWYFGFWNLLEFGMQVILILITGYSIALSSTVKKGINVLAKYINTPSQVYIFVVIIGMSFSLISWGWLVITSVLARELALRVRGINYYYLIACVYFSGGLWVCGLSSSIPLLLNTNQNFLLEQEVMSSTLSTSFTLGSVLNFSVIGLYYLVSPLLFWALAPKKTIDLQDLVCNDSVHEPSIKKEAGEASLDAPALSDKLNNNWIIQFLVASMGLIFLVYYFYTNGFDLNLNIMIFFFIIIGLYLHRTPIRYSIAMKRASSNISGILFQYPFYAGIMGIMLTTGLGERLAEIMAEVATESTYPFFAFLTGGFVNFAIPSAGGEFAVIGPSIISAVQEIGINSNSGQVDLMIARASMSIAYGESLTNLLQPFYLLIVLPIMGKGIKVQARDVMGYLIIPFVVMFILIALLVTFIPLV